MKNRSFWIGVLIAVLTTIASSAIWWYFYDTNEVKLTNEIADLENRLDDIGPIGTVLTVSVPTNPGETVVGETIQHQSYPTKLITSNMITSASQVSNSYYKIAITPGTPLTTDMFMKEELSDTLRDVDIYLDWWSSGIEVGNYIDLRIRYPMGEDFIVIPHKRVMALGANTMKLYLDEVDQYRYIGATLDYFLNKDKGTVIYATKYVEPGIQEEAKAFYAVPSQIKSMMDADPNITDKTAPYLYESWRERLDDAFLIMDPAIYGSINSGMGSFISAMNGGTVTEENTSNGVDFDENVDDLMIDMGNLETFE